MDGLIRMNHSTTHLSQIRVQQFCRIWLCGFSNEFFVLSYYSPGNIIQHLIVLFVMKLKKWNFRKLARQTAIKRQFNNSIPFSQEFSVNIDDYRYFLLIWTEWYGKGCKGICLRLSNRKPWKISKDQEQSD